MIIIRFNERKEGITKKDKKRSTLIVRKKFFVSTKEERIMYVQKKFERCWFRAQQKKNY